VKVDLSNISPSLTTTLADRYRVERELGQGGMATLSAAESRGSADVAEATGGAVQPGMASSGWCVC